MDPLSRSRRHRSFVQSHPKCSCLIPSRLPSPVEHIHVPEGCVHSVHTIHKVRHTEARYLIVVEARSYPCGCEYLYTASTHSSIRGDYYGLLVELFPPGEESTCLLRQASVAACVVLFPLVAAIPHAHTNASATDIE